MLQVAFVPNTHYVFSVGKDGLLKYWDADRWELLLELAGHHAEVCAPLSKLQPETVSSIYRSCSE